MIVSDISQGVLPPDAQVVTALLEGNEEVFAALVTHHHSTMLRLAMLYVPDVRVAEDVIQETWIGVLRGLAQFQARSSLKTWIFSILINRAKTQARREERFAHLALVEEDDFTTAEPSVALDRFRPADQEWGGHWAVDPQNWESVPEDKLISQETQQVIEQAIATLPSKQREVIVLRDIQQWSPEEVCQILGLTEVNQRVLLHRARSKVRQLLEDYLSEGEETP